MKRILILSILGLAFTGYTYASDCGDSDNYPEVSMQELKSMLDKKAVFVVDVNGEDSFKEAHIPGAIHYGTHKKDFAAKLPKDKNATIVAYCGSNKCTAWEKAAEAACNLGYKNVKHFKPGIKGWKEAHSKT